MLDTKNTPPRRVLRVQRSPRPIFDAARRVSPLLVMSNTHFDVARRVNTLVVTSKPNPPYPGHGYGFWAGDPNSTRTRTRPTRTRLPARVCKPVTNPNAPSLETQEGGCSLPSMKVEKEHDGMGGHLKSQIEITVQFMWCIYYDLSVQFFFWSQCHTSPHLSLQV